MDKEGLCAYGAVQRPTTGVAADAFGSRSRAAKDTEEGAGIDSIVAGCCGGVSEHGSWVAGAGG